MKQEEKKSSKDESSGLDKAIDDIVKMQDSLKQNIHKEAESEEGEQKEDPEKDPVYLLLDSILKNSAEILSNPAVTQLFEKLIPKIGKDETISLIQSLSIIMSYSAYSSLLLYDDLLKGQLQQEFDHISKHINFAKADLAGMQGALEVFKKRLGDVENTVKIDKIKKDEHID